MALVLEAKVALFEALRRAVPRGVQCTFAETGKSDRRQQVWLGATGDEELTVSAMRQGPRKPMALTSYVDVHALVITPGDPIGAERAVYGLRDAITDACRSVAPASVPGLLDVRPESSETETAESTDGAYAALTVRVRIRGRIT
ncbi:hypothetical protein A6A06_23525 [Streptomyces sp. CB02923]|uniref:hypothetical protein n=1 Tax=Streptomyces sp. CB02923 TaxID=1718985 RepID=UPI00093F2AB4|nr:hypothetical protein [Streptomyces sp. CB02923]OKH99993.1 hypothetical protein A6A06_23525 [Streptomyces sp. CB02923]